MSSSEDEEPQTRRRASTRRTVVNYKEDADGDAVMAEQDDDYDDDDEGANDNDDEDEMELDEEEEESEEEEEESRSRRRRSSRRQTSSKRSSKAKPQQQPQPDVSRRTSSRSNKFTSSMAEPGNAIGDLMAMSEQYDDDDDGPTANNKKPTSKKRASRPSLSSAAADEEEFDDDDDEDYKARRRPSARGNGRSKKTTTRKIKSAAGGGSPHKSPARRHAQRRRSLNYSDAADDEDTDSVDTVDDVSEAEDEEEEMETLKIQRILASRTETRKTWKELCAKMNTTEIDYGSRWFQGEATENDKKKKKNGEDAAATTTSRDDEIYEERFLIKWADLSYLHCSWETRADVLEQIEQAKGYFSTFFRKSHNGLLFTPDERCDGDYFDPAFTEIDRILEIQLPEDDTKIKLTVDKEDGFTETSFGMIMDKSDPEFENGTGRQFLIKWCNTPYSDATFEFERDLILNEIEYKGKVKDFLRRSTKPSKRKKESWLKKGDEELRRLYKIFGDRSPLDEATREKAVEKYKRDLQARVYKNGGQLRDYQGEGVAWMVSNFCNGRSSLLGDEMGLGKTLQTAVLVELLATKLNRGGPALVVVPLSTIAHWSREFASWTDLNVIVYHGSSEDRNTIRRQEMAYESDRPLGGLSFNQLFLKKCGSRRYSKSESPWMVDVVITTPEMIVADDYVELTAVQWEILVVDEAHRLKNANSKLAVSLRDKRFSFAHTLLLTGTPIQNSVEEFWSLLNLIDPDLFGDADEFMEMYGDMKSKERIDELHEEIRPYILRRLKEDVEKSVPAKEETIIEVELTVQQKQWYRALYEKNVGFLHRNKKKAIDGPGMNNLAMELRKCCNHLFLLNGVEEEFRREEAGSNLSEADFLVKASGKLVLLDKLLPRLKEQGHRVLIFSQFKIMLDLLEDWLAMIGFKFERIDGSITGSRRQKAIDRFQAPATEGKEPPFIMMLSTRAGGVGINLTAADTVIIFDSDFNPQNDLQAQARCHRIGQKKVVKVYRLLTRKTYEMQMFHVSSLKMGLDQAVLAGFEGSSSGEGALSKEEVEKLLRHGAYDIFNEEKEGAAETESNNFVQQDIDSIMERRSRTVIHDNTGSKSNAAGGTFSKARFMSTSKSPDADNQSKAAQKTNGDIDIEDPDFWKKMLGEPKATEEEYLGPRQRSRQNYSEKEYQKRLDATLQLSEADSDSDSFTEDEDADEEADHARRHWGGKNPHEWKKDDAESVTKCLLTFGYGVKSWDEVMGSLQLTKDYGQEEVKRMCWSMVLTTAIETAAEEVGNAKKREERAAEKKRKESLDNSGEGGVLAADLPPAVEIDENKLEEEKEKAFVRTWKEIATWSPGLVNDAIEYAKAHEPRDRETLELITGVDKSHKLSTDAVASKFSESVWPSLKSRGWTAVMASDGDTAGQTKYKFKDKEFGTIEAVLVSARDLHSELATMIDTLLSSIEANRAQSIDSLKQERSTHLGMTVENVDIPTITSFLLKYAPLQLLSDRRKAANRIRLPKRLLSICSLLHIASDLVGKVKPKADGSVDIDKLQDSLSVDKRSTLPHPLWTLRHDAVLILAISKHGWIDQDASCRAITNDSAIKWGPPFDSVGKSADSDKTSISKELLATSKRAASFVTKHHSEVSEIKGFNHNLVVRTYGLNRSNDEDGQPSHKWIVDEPKLRLSPNADESNGQELAELPTKKDLVRRAKFVLAKTASKATSAEAEAKATEKQSHGFAVLDQSERCNVFLAELMRAVLKTPATAKGVGKLCGDALQEARKRVEETTSDDGEASPGNTDLHRIWNQLYTVKQSIFKATTQCKNVIRVMLGEEPFKPKNSSDELFPKIRQQNFRPLVTKPVAKKSPPREKKSTAGQPRTVARTARSTAETVIATGRKKLKDIYSDPSRARAGAFDDFLELTEIETLILSLLSTYGVPVWSEEAMRELNAGDEQSDIFSWRLLGKLLKQSAKEEQAKADRVYKGAKSESDKESKMTGDRSRLMTLMELESDFIKKQAVVAQAGEYESEPETLAKKSTMLLAKVRQQWGTTTVSAFFERAYNGLGSKAMIWYDKELARWAHALELLDSEGQPLGYTAVDFLYDVTDEQRNSIQVSSVLDKKGCRSVVGQITMLTRLRALKLSFRESELDAKIDQAVTTINESNDIWEHEPHWWRSETSGNENDKLLLEKMMDVGITDSLIEIFAAAGEKVKDAPRFCRLSKLDLQRRANQLIRELHIIAMSDESTRRLQDRRASGGDSLGTSTLSSSGRGSSHSKKAKHQHKSAKNSSSSSQQKGLDSFFGKKHQASPDPTDSLVVEPSTEDNGDVPVASTEKRALSQEDDETVPSDKKQRTG